MKKAVFIVLAALSLCSCTIKTTEYARRTVSVSGRGSVEVDADNATIVLSVITRGKDVGTAAKENAEKMTSVQEAVIGLGISKDNISTEGYTIDQETSYTNGKVIYGDYVTTNRIKVFVKDLSIAGEVIDSALKAGANRLSSFQYGITDKDAYVKQARTLAVQNAHDAANLIATTSGALLGRVITLSEHTNNYSVYNYKALAAPMAEAASDTAMDEVSTPISAGKTTISFTVDAVYELK